jgi:lipopolysaccharide export system protein LptA
MAKKVANIPKVEHSNLLSKVSADLQNLLDKHKIEYTTGDISVLRNSILINLSNVGINENNYDNKKYDELKAYTMNLEIDKLYNTKYHLKDTLKRKSNKLERLSD